MQIQELAKSYYLDRVGRPHCGLTHKGLSRDVARRRTRIYSRGESEAVGVEYGTLYDVGALHRRPGPTPVESPSEPVPVAKEPAASEPTPTAKASWDALPPPPEPLFLDEADDAPTPSVADAQKGPEPTFDESEPALEPSVEDPEAEISPETARLIAETIIEAMRAMGEHRHGVRPDGPNDITRDRYAQVWLGFLRKRCPSWVAEVDDLVALGGMTMFVASTCLSAPPEEAMPQEPGEPGDLRSIDELDVELAS